MANATLTDGSATVHVMTVDVEDYFHVSVFAPFVPRDGWDRYESRVVANTERVLELLAAANTNGTFFVLGWVADKYPDLARRIAAAGHELASHSYWHRLVYDLSPEEFREDLKRAKGAIGDATGVEVRGFRAPSYSVTKRSLWALDVLAEQGYAYDASIFPIRHDRYGIPGAPRMAHIVDTRHGSILEVPSTAARVAGMTVPIGGGYFRLLPYAVTRWAMQHFAEAEGQPSVFYIHPWEFDPAQPRLSAPAFGRFRHYNNLAETAPRFQQLLRDFRFGSIEAVMRPSATQAVARPKAVYA